MDEATIRIKLEGGRARAAGGGTPPAPAGAPPKPVDPYRDVSDRLKKPRRDLDELAHFSGQLRGAFSSVFGGLLGAVMEATLAWHDMTKRASQATPSSPRPTSPLVQAIPTQAIPSVTPGQPLGTATPVQNPKAWTRNAAGTFQPPAAPKPVMPVAKPAPASATPIGAAPAAGATSGAGALAAAAGPLAIAAAAVVAAKIVTDMFTGMARTVTDTMVSLTSASTHASQPLEVFGTHLTKLGESIGIVNPALSFLATMTGELANTMAQFMRNLDALAKRYEMYDPSLSISVALADVRQTLGDLRRGRDIGPELGRYITEQSKMQQAYEDLKVEFMRAILPVATDTAQVTTQILKFIKEFGPLIQLAVGQTGIAMIVRLLARWLPRDTDADLTIPDPLATILEDRGIRVP